MLRFIDLFAGMGGIRLGFEQGARALGIASQCVFTSEIKPSALKVLRQNHPEEAIHGDISQIPSHEIPDFDVLLAGFPCQAFSSAGKRGGFADTRGTLFFQIERILRDKKPRAFILENVEGLVSHDKQDKSEPIGQTLRTILSHLEALGYQCTWEVLNARDYSVPQERKRIYIVGHQGASLIPMPPKAQQECQLSSLLEQGLPTEQSPFIKALLKHYRPEELKGKSIKDKRGGKDNIHSWEIGAKGQVSKEEAQLLNRLLLERRKKKWAQEVGIEWMDGMSLSLEQISTFYPKPQLAQMLNRLVKLGYLKREHPKRRLKAERQGQTIYYREQDKTLPLGYNIVAGKLSFPITKILDPEGIAPTLVATDMAKLYVVDGKGLRPLSLREGLRLCGYPESYRFEVSLSEGYDLIGNTVVVPVIEAITKELLQIIQI